MQKNSPAFIKMQCYNYYFKVTIRKVKKKKKAEKCNLDGYIQEGNIISLLRHKH